MFVLSVRQFIFFRYNPPEILRSYGKDELISARKCDIWALGLLCWETLRQGQHYYDDDKVKSIITQSYASQDSQNQASRGLESHQDSGNTSSRALLGISHLLAQEAYKWIDRDLDKDAEWPHFDKLLLRGIFKNTLKVDASQRIENVSRLPLVHGDRSVPEVSQNHTVA